MKPPLTPSEVRHNVWPGRRFWLRISLSPPNISLPLYHTLLWWYFVMCLLYRVFLNFDFFAVYFVHCSSTYRSWKRLPHPKVQLKMTLIWMQSPWMSAMSKKQGAKSIGNCHVCVFLSFYILLLFVPCSIFIHFFLSLLFFSWSVIHKSMKRRCLFT